MSTSPHSPDLLPTSSEPVPERGIDLIAVLAALLSQWRFGLAIYLPLLVVSITWVFLIHPKYQAEAAILPQASRTESASLSSIFSTKGPGALYIGFLKSRTVQDVAIDRAHLLTTFHTNSYETARNILSAKTEFTEGSDSIVRITVRDENAVNAAAMANAYLDGLSVLNQGMAFEESKQTREFFEKQLGQEKDELASAEEVLEKTQERTGIVQSETQTSIGLNTIAGLRSQITSLKVQRAALSESAAPQNPELIRLDSEIAQLEAQERKQEVGGGAPMGAAPSATEIPQRNLDVARAERDVRDRNVLVNSLNSQFQAARLDEAFSHQQYEVIDRAVPPEKKAWPPHSALTALAILLCGMIAFGCVILRLVIRRLVADPENEKSLAALRHVFGKA